MPLELPEIPPIPESERTPLVEALLQIIEIQRSMLLSRITELESENVQLKERVARLEKNSSNSSKPPSSDITTRKEEQRQPGVRKIGGQPGHKANWRRGFTETEIDRRKKLELLRCPECKTKLEPTQDAIIHQQAELVAKPVFVTEYQLRGGFCPCCNKTAYPELPFGVIPGQLLGPRLLTLFGDRKSVV